MKRMGLRKLTLTEIELRISRFRERSETLSGVINDITDGTAKKSLQQQVNRYRTLLNDLYDELENRRQASN